MLENLSNYTKALLITEDLTEIAAISQDDCMTVQHFDYHCSRSRNEMGEPYGPVVSVTLQVSIKALSNSSEKLLYERLKSNARYPYSFIFNATFDSWRKLSSYENAMVVSGYVVDVEETYDSAFSSETETDQMLMNVKILLSSITYIGKQSNKTLFLIQ